ncbi:MAG: tetratricopeptide repeat protein [Gammaproteobacteria bacterium]|nr:tetratricopeptide repeat protein [Gammaproteobacteria bacterium]
MTCWEVLCIRPTTSQRMIKKAYADLLKRCNPEDKPQEFQTLRKAYERALAESRLVESSPDAGTPPEPEHIINPPTPSASAPTSSAVASASGTIVSVEALRTATEGLYQNVKKRWQLQAWQQLLQEPIFWDLNSCNAVGTFYIRFLAAHHYLPKQVLFELNRFLRFSEEYARWRQQTDLADAAEQLIIYLNTLHLRLDHTAIATHAIPFDMLHKHLQLREQMENAYIFESASIDALAPLYRQVQPECSADFDLQAFMARLYLQAGELPVATDLYEQVVAAQSEPAHMLDLAEIYYQSENVAQASALYQDVLSRNPSNIRGLKGIALCHLKQRRPEIAAHLLEEVVRQVPSDIQMKAALTAARRDYCLVLERNAGQSPSEIESNIRTRAQLLYDLQRFTECLELITQCPVTFPDGESVLPALCYSGLGQDDDALAAFYGLIRNIRAKGENPLDSVKDMIIHYHYLLPEDVLHELVMPYLSGLSDPHAADPDYVFAAALAFKQIEYTLTLSDEQTQHYKNWAVECINRAVAIQPLNEKYHYQRGFIMSNAERYEDALESHRYARQSRRHGAHLSRCMGNCYVALERFDEAFDAYEEALSYTSDGELRKMLLERICTASEKSGNFSRAVNIVKEIQSACESLHPELFLETQYQLASLYMKQDERHNQEWSEATVLAHEQFVDHCANGYDDDSKEELLKIVLGRLSRYFDGKDRRKTKHYQRQLASLR